MKNILVPTDFSANAKDALVYALNFLKGGDAKIHVLSVLGLPPRAAVGATGSLAIRMKENAQEKMRLLIDEMHNISVDIDPIIREGSTVSVILSTAKEVQADAIVMGTKGSTGLESVILGSIASKVIERSPVPVISVPKGFEFSGLNRILYPTDFQKSTSETLKKLVKLTKRFNSRIDVLHIYPDDEEVPLESMKQIASEMAGEMQERKITFHAHPNSSIAKGIIAFMGASETEMLAMVTKRRNLIRRLFDGSLTKRFSMTATVPMVTFQAVEK